MIIDPLQDGKSAISLISYMGGDLDVVNDAKASYAKQATEMGHREVKLLHFLLSPITEPQHTSPLRGTTFKFQVKAPLFVCRQWWKHVIGSATIEEQVQWNEMSLRYTEAADGDYYTPHTFRSQHEKNKQGSGVPLDYYENSQAKRIWEMTCDDSFRFYKELISLGVSREQARGILVPTMYTQFRWTASLQSVLHFIDLREGHGAQSEIAAYANAVSGLISPVVPHTMRIWNDRKAKIEAMFDKL